MAKFAFVYLISAAALAGPAVAQSSATAFYPPSGFDLSAIDQATKPGDDFFQYANGK